MKFGSTLNLANINFGPSICKYSSFIEDLNKIEIVQGPKKMFAKHSLEEPKQVSAD